MCHWLVGHDVDNIAADSIATDNIATDNIATDNIAIDNIVPCPLFGNSSSWPNAMLWFAAVSWPDGFDEPSCHDLA